MRGQDAIMGCRRRTAIFAAAMAAAWLAPAVGGAEASAAGIRYATVHHACAPARVDHDADRVEAQLGRPWPVLHVGEVRRGHAPHLRALALVQRLPRAATGAARPPRLDLDEHERGAVVDDQVDLAPPGPVVAGDELEAEPFEVGEREVLAGAAEVLSGVGGHGRPR